MKMYIKKERHDKRRALRHEAIRLPFRSEKSNEFGLFSRFCKTIKKMLLQRIEFQRIVKA